MDERDEVLTLPRLVTGFALLGLIFAGAVAPSAAHNLVVVTSFSTWSTPEFAAVLAVLIVGGLFAVAVIALRSSRVWAWITTAGSAVWLVVAGLLVLGFATLAWNAVSPPLAGGWLLPVAMVLTLGLFWAHSIARGGGDKHPSANALGWLLIGVGLAGIALTTAAMLEVAALLPRYRWDAGLTAGAFVVTGLAGALSLAVLILGLRRLAAGALRVPGVRAKRVLLVTNAQAREAVALLGFTVALTFVVASLGFFGRVSEGSDLALSLVVPTLLLVVALAIPAAVAMTAEGTFESPGRGRAYPDSAAGLSFSGLVIAIGLLGLIVVTAASPIAGLSISHAVRVADGLWRTMLPLQAVAFAVPLAILLAGRIRARQAEQSPDGDSETITLPRLVLCLALFSPVIAAPSLPWLPFILSERELGSLWITSIPALLFHLAGGGAVLVVTLLLVLGWANRWSAFASSSSLPVTAAFAALGVVAVVAGYSGTTFWSVLLSSSTRASYGAPLVLVALLGLGVVTLLWFRSEVDISPGAASVVAVWRSASVPLLGLAFLVPLTPRLIIPLVEAPTHGVAILMMAGLALAYTINVWFLMGATQQLRYERVKPVA